MPFFDWTEDSSEEDIDECPSPPETPLAPPPIPPIPTLPPDLQELFPIPPFQPFERYLRDTRPRQHRTTLRSIHCLHDIETDDMTSAAWSDRMQSVRECRRSENKVFIHVSTNRGFTSTTNVTEFPTSLLLCTLIMNNPLLLI